MSEKTRLERYNDLDGLGEYQKADKRMVEARVGYVTAFRKENMSKSKPNGRYLPVGYSCHLLLGNGAKV